ncbi:AmmeMemoRadiSam system radical SAM enzyme [Candidatus Pacearchaeota archaeon]|nr:AmmeMemoRadiSam system radical SAM enzyme [Candidatus Pacearchaeota archaeon]
MKECDLYKKMTKGNVKCLACSHYCIISEGKTGICGVRKNVRGKLNLMVYGKVVASHTDPIEKKPLYKFLSGTLSYSIGTIGCNFKCSFCQNWDISQAKINEDDFFGKNMNPQEIVNRAISNGCKSISYTYNDPIIFVEFVKDICKIAHKKGLKNIMVTNGFWSKESFSYIKDYIDAVNIDLKGDSDFYKKYCGGRLEPVLETIKRCHESGIHVEITTLLMNGMNDSDEGLKKIAMFISSLDKNIVWHISRFFPNYKMDDREITSRDSLEGALKIGKKYLDNVYLGNI